MKNTDLLAESVLENSEKEIEIFYYSQKEFRTMVSNFLNTNGMDDKSYQCLAYFFSDEKNQELGEVSEDFILGLLDANLGLKPTFCKDYIAIWKHGKNFTICGISNKEIEPLCVLSPRTSSVPWVGLRLLAVSDIARQEGVEYYGFDKYLTIIDLKKKEKDGRKGILLSEGASTIESLLQ